VQDFAVESGLLDLDRVDAAADTLAAENQGHVDSSLKHHDA
jgi:hypothetical protein